MDNKIIYVSQPYWLKVRRIMDHEGTEEDSQKALSDIEKLLGPKGFTSRGIRRPATPVEEWLQNSFKFRLYDVGSDRLKHLVYYARKERGFEESNTFNIAVRDFESPASIALLGLIRDYYLGRRADGFEVGEIEIGSPWSIERAE